MPLDSLSIRFALLSTLTRCPQKGYIRTPQGCCRRRKETGTLSAESGSARQQAETELKRFSIEEKTYSLSV
jgi:hypothetical protein